MNIHQYINKLKVSSLSRHIPNISLDNAEYIQDILRKRKPEHILEIGTANGYSTLLWVSAFGGENHVFDITTIERAWNAHNEAVEHCKNCKVKNIHAIWGDARKIIPSLQDRYFDFCFMDGMKREYLDYLFCVIPKLTEGALIILDDVEKFREKMENLYTWLEKNHIQYSLTKTDEDDSIMLIESRNLFVST